MGRGPQKAIDRVGQIAGQLLHPRPVRLRVDPGDGHAAGLQLDDEEDQVPLETRQREHLNREQIAGGEAVPMSPVRTPSTAFVGPAREPVRSRGRAGSALPWSGRCRGRGSRARRGYAYTPLRILNRHLYHEVGHVAWRHRPTSTSVGAAVVLLGNQSPVPAENRVRRDDTGDLRQDPPAEFLAADGEPTLGVGRRSGRGPSCSPRTRFSSRR